jgi:hypothetical protein
MYRRCVLAVWIGVLSFVGLATVGPRTAAEEQDEGRGGTVVGVLEGKGENHIELKADGEERARRYVPRWVGGLPKDGGGPDKEMVKAIRELKVGSRLRIEWKFEERPRVLKIEVLKAPEKKQ